MKYKINDHHSKILLLRGRYTMVTMRNPNNKKGYYKGLKHKVRLIPSKYIKEWFNKRRNLKR